MGCQAKFVLNDRGSMRQALGIAVLGNHDDCIDGCRVQRWITGKQCLGGLDTQVRGFLIGVLARQEVEPILPKIKSWSLPNFAPWA